MPTDLTAAGALVLAFLRALSRWAIAHGFNVVIIVVGGWAAIRAANLAIGRLQHTLGRGAALTDLEWQRRAATLGGILTSLVTASVAFVAILMLLRELSIDVMPILTGAGIAGLAIGFGAQNLVRDVISGFFLILEDQVRVGDLARINGVAGTVEQINLRTIVIRCCCTFGGHGILDLFDGGFRILQEVLLAHRAAKVVFLSFVLDDLSRTHFANFFTADGTELIGGLNRRNNRSCPSVRFHFFSPGNSGERQDQNRNCH